MARRPVEGTSSVKFQQLEDVFFYLIVAGTIAISVLWVAGGVGAIAP